MAAPLKEWIEEERRNRANPFESILHSIRELRVPEEHVEAYLKKTLLALPGWTGMVEQMATNANWTLHPAREGSLEEFLAVRLILDRLAIEDCLANRLAPRSYTASDIVSFLVVPRRNQPRYTIQQRAFAMFQLAQRFGWTPRDLHEWEPSAWSRLSGELDSFDALERRRIFHLAYENRYRTDMLNALSLHASLP